MENLEQRCLEKLNNILSKFDLKIELINISSFLEYLLVDNSLPEIEYLSPWLSISHILLVDGQSIFDYLKKYYDTVNSSNIIFSDSQLSKFQRYSKVYQSIQSLKSNSLEEFLINCDLMGI